MISTPIGIPRRGRSRGKIIKRRIDLGKDDEQHKKHNKRGRKLKPTSPADESASSRLLSKSKSLDSQSIEGSLNCEREIPPDKKRKSLGEVSIFRTPGINSTLAKNIYAAKSRTQNEEYEKAWSNDRDRILKKYWKICHLSSVNDFFYFKKNLKSSYLRMLRGKVSDAYPSFLITVDMVASSFLKQRPGVIDSLFFEIQSLIPGENGEEDKMVVVYEALMIKTDHVQSSATTFTQWFPILLYKGNDAIHHAFCRWLQSSFGCYISPQGLSATCMTWLTAVWVSGKCTNIGHQKFEERKIVLKYLVRPPLDLTLPPPNEKRKFTVKITLFAQAFANMWKKIKNSEKETRISDVAKFHKWTEEYIEEQTGIPSEMLQLLEIRTPCNFISSSGRIRLSCDTTFHSLLNHLVEIFLSTCNLYYVGKENDFTLDHDEDEEE